MADYVTCESTKICTLPLGAEKDVGVEVERLSDEEVHEEVPQPVSASQSNRHPPSIETAGIKLPCSRSSVSRITTAAASCPSA